MICETLREVLTQASINSHVKPAPFLAGVVFGVSAAPDIPMPEVWMPWVLDGPHDLPLSNESVDTLAGGLIAQLQWQLGSMRSSQHPLPEQCTWSDEPEQRVDLELWLQGLLFAHQQLEPAWQTAWQQTHVKDGSSRLTRCLKCFSVLADSRLTLDNLDQEQAEKLSANLPVLAQQLNGLLVDYINLAGELAQHLPGQFEIYSDLSKLSKN